MRRWRRRHERIPAAGGAAQSPCPAAGRAVRAGRLLAEPDGSFDFEKSAARWHATAGGRADVAARHAAQRGAGIPEGRPSAKNAPAAADSRGERLDMPAADGAGRAGAKAALLHDANQQIKITLKLKVF